MPCPATDFGFRFSITLLNVVITRIDYDALNNIVSVSLAVGSCQDIFFVDDGTTAPIYRTIYRNSKADWRTFRNKIINQVVLRSSGRVQIVLRENIEYILSYWKFSLIWKLISYSVISVYNIIFIIVIFRQD